MTIAQRPLAENRATGSIGFATPLSLLGAGALIMAAMFLPVVQSSDATRTGYTIRRHEQELSDINARIYQLQAEAAQLGAMGRIASEAARLGMVAASHSSIPVTVNFAAPVDVVLPRRYLPTEIPQPTAAHHGTLWSILHPLSPR